MQKEVILTGIRANNDLHIGNYFGALLPIVDMAKYRAADYRINLFVPDLHSITTPIDYDQLQKQIMHNLKIFAAAGLPLDNPNIKIYRQSYIPAHSELTWILDCFAYFGELSRMTQFKDKSKDYLLKEQDGRLLTEYGRPLELESSGPAGKNISAGLFNYPVLMAADILLYGAKYVPVGDDQSQHLEFTRDIAMRMNNHFGELFVVPEPVAKQHEFFGKDQGLRIRDLSDPTKKMSKSDDSGKGIIFMGDDPEAAAQKIMSATTDSFTDGIKEDPAERPGVYNLLQIYELLKPGGKEDALNLSSYSELKSKVASYVKEFLTDFQAKIAQVNEAELMKKLENDEADANNTANSALAKVQQAVGLRPKP